MADRDKAALARKEKREYQAKLRAAADAAGRCRQCEAPAAVNPKTGKKRRQCDRHLELDNFRKGAVPLPWGDPDEEHPIEWLVEEDIPLVIVPGYAGIAYELNWL